MTSPATTLLTVTAVHLGFQATVSTLVYPALARVPTAQWPSAHRAHSTAIVPVVALVYGALLICGVWVLLSDPDLWLLTSLAAIALTFLITALGAAPAHSRLGAGHDSEQLRQLLVIDRFRAATATLAFAAAAIAVL